MYRFTLLTARSTKVIRQRQALSTFQPPLITSRRAWLVYRKRHPPPAINKTAQPKEEEKPWPRNMIIAGYALASIFVPYSFAWYLSMDARIRHLVTSAVPGFEDILRSHFGHEEQTPYQDLKEGIKPKKKLDDEDTFIVRRQQEVIEDLTNEVIPVKVFLFNGGSMISTEATFKGTTLATSSNLLPKGSDGTVAVEFDDLPVHEVTVLDEIAAGFQTYSDSRADHIYSYWFYQPPTNPQEKRKTQQSSVQDIEITRLEYMIKTLEGDLKDVNSTRDIDDMQLELARCKSELRSLRWKKRLGWA